MSKKKSSENYMKAAKDSLELAETLAGKPTKLRTDKEFLESMARCDELADHPDANTPEGTCGHCCTQICHAEAARQLLAAGDTEDGIRKWSELARKLWQDSKYYKLYQAEQAAGRDPHKAFEERGWEM